ncbi:MAG: DinB family protein, partial [Gemmatimonadota bacterium]|nr:DinB family protein [Gemmatimonadota bacterium]
RGRRDRAVSRPDRSEYAEYYDTYVSLVPDGDIVEMLEDQLPETRALLDAVPPERERWAYAEGKWTIREVVGHLMDAERVFAGRALWIARDPETVLPSMEQDRWAERSNAGARPLTDLLDEWETIRRATVAMARSFDAAALERTGIASGVRFTVRSFPWIIAGHELHHRRLFRERYGLG